MGSSPRHERHAAGVHAPAPVPASTPKTGLLRLQSEAGNGAVAALIARVERASGVALGDVRVHHGSSAPAALGAYAFTQGRDVHLGPGQERHLPHELWHVVQQKQGRVPARFELGGVPVNDDPALEHEAEVRGHEVAAAPASAVVPPDG